MSHAYMELDHNNARKMGQGKISERKSYGKKPNETHILISCVAFNTMSVFFGCPLKQTPKPENAVVHCVL